ncbi:MAG: methionine biosynthesis protein MetW [Candidatus Omnitrophica bacterium CG_4_8_14_3_um_filter_43_15]|nr:MAG: methionine biosynthesis protein MetW [Candidatus Omnitrophica bacterium CG_4_8_14_3_um_filter_43_15]PJC46427.1 MAG: methionine biosynthesis protein MetW [Candidatus Omnitrophica bacterium CG_4_9_14_0_2_um_filter_43_12]
MDLSSVRLDEKIIYGIIEPGSKVLDLGCGDGELLHLLAKGKNVKGQGIELSDDAIYKCVEKEVSVFHGDIDSGLVEYPGKSFDYVILNQSMQQVKKIEYVLQEALRVGRKTIVGFPNFASIKARCMLCFGGRSPVTSSLPNYWYDTPNLRFLSIKDFKVYCRQKGMKIDQEYYLSDKRKISFCPNLFASSAIFVIEK